MIDNGKRINRIINRPTEDIIQHLRETTPEDAQDVRAAWRNKNTINILGLVAFTTPVWGFVTVNGENAVTLSWFGHTWEWRVR